MPQIGRPGLLNDAAELVRALGSLPLALAQAAAYMLDRQLSYAAYRVRLAGRRLASVVPEPGGLSDEHRATVAATWSLSVRQADLLIPEGVARPLLEVASVLDANGIPLEVFTALAVLEFAHRDGRTGHRRARCAGRAGVFGPVEAGYGEPRFAVAGGAVHALVQRATPTRSTQLAADTYGSRTATNRCSVREAASVTAAWSQKPETITRSCVTPSFTI
ncbi:hypothetical protein [Lentzea jiangxiensis]|uniref:hypothetical protein n=1 Tax=Lentzea jiangxiensis TaxID=641025 RepID=UPI00115FF7ED|nr:hypothetical protein [Lentzea jiangxiensis]